MRADREAHRQALQGLLRETRAARMADRLPEERRPRGGLLISIGMGEPEPEPPMAEGYDDEDDETG